MRTTHCSSPQPNSGVWWGLQPRDVSQWEAMKTGAELQTYRHIDCNTLHHSQGWSPLDWFFLNLHHSQRWSPLNSFFLDPHHTIPRGEVHWTHSSLIRTIPRGEVHWTHSSLIHCWVLRAEALLPICRHANANTTVVPCILYFTYSEDNSHILRFTIPKWGR